MRRRSQAEHQRRCRRGRARATRRGATGGAGRRPCRRGRLDVGRAAAAVVGVESSRRRPSPRRTSAVGGHDPGVHGRAVARARLDDDRARPARGHLGRAVARAVVDHDHAEARRGCRRAGRERRRLVAAREHEVAEVHVVQGRRGRAPQRGPEPYEPLTCAGRLAAAARRRLPRVGPWLPAARPRLARGRGLVGWSAVGAAVGWRRSPCPSARLGRRTSAATVPAAPRGSGSRGSGPGTLPAVLLVGALGVAAPARSRSGCPGAAAARVVRRRRWPGCVARARRRPDGHRRGSCDRVRVPPHRARRRRRRRRRCTSTSTASRTSRRTTGRCTSPATRRARCCSSSRSSGSGSAAAWRPALVGAAGRRDDRRRGAGRRCVALGAEDAARRAAPFLVFGPAAIWHGGLRRRDVRRGRGVGAGCLALRPPRAAAGAGRLAVVAGLLLGYVRDVVVRPAAAGPLALAVLVAARGPGGRCRGPRCAALAVVLALRAGRLRLVGGLSGAAASGTGTGSPADRPTRTGSGATSPRCASAPDPLSARGSRRCVDCAATRRRRDPGVVAARRRRRSPIVARATCPG